MRRLTNFTGGRGYYVNDVQELQGQIDQLATAFASIGDTFVLQGCELNNGIISPGLVFHQGRVLAFAGATLPPNQPYPVFAYGTGTDALAGEPWVNYYYDLEDTTKPAFEGRYLRFMGGVAPSGAALASGAFLSWQPSVPALTMQGKVTANIVKAARDNASEVDVAGVFNLRRDMFGRVFVQGVLSMVFVFPPGFRPATPKVLNGLGIRAADLTLSSQAVTVNIDGTISYPTSAIMNVLMLGASFDAAS